MNRRFRSIVALALCLLAALPAPANVGPRVGLWYECGSSTGPWGLWSVLAREGWIAAVSKPISPGDPTILTRVREFRPDFVIFHRPRGQPPQCTQMSIAADYLIRSAPSLERTAGNDAEFVAAMVAVATAAGPQCVIVIYEGGAFENEAPFSYQSADADIEIVNQSLLPDYRLAATTLPVRVVIDAAAVEFPAQTEERTVQGVKQRVVTAAASTHNRLVRAAEQYLDQRGIPKGSEPWPHKFSPHLADPNHWWIIRGHDIAGSDPAMNPGAKAWAASRENIAGPIIAAAPAPEKYPEHLARGEWIAVAAHDFHVRTAAGVKALPRP